MSYKQTSQEQGDKLHTSIFFAAVNREWMGIGIGVAYMRGHVAVLYLQ